MKVRNATGLSKFGPDMDETCFIVISTLPLW
jgi:hypothetical protein